MCVAVGLELLRCPPAPRGLRPYATPAPAHQSPAGIILISADRGINYTQSLGQQEPRGAHTRKAKAGRSVAVGSPWGDLSRCLHLGGILLHHKPQGSSQEEKDFSAKTRRSWGRLEARVWASSSTPVTPIPKCPVRWRKIHPDKITAKQNPVLSGHGEIPHVAGDGAAVPSPVPVWHGGKAGSRGGRALGSPT